VNALLEVKGLRVDIPLEAGILHAVRGVDIVVERGKTLALVGESGCGKSLSVLSVMDLLPQKAKWSADKIFFDGKNLNDAGTSRMADIRGSKIAMIFQEPMTSLNPCYTIGNQLEEALLTHKQVSRKDARDRAVFLLEKVGITAAASRLRQYPHQLSGGLRQRVMIAMGLMCGPPLLIADEPTTALDVTIQAQILALLAAIQKEFDMGMILITHDLGVVARIADHVNIMYCGQVVESGSAIDLFNNPLHPYTQGLLRCIPIPGKTAPGAHLGSIPGMVPTPIGQQVGCVFQNRCEYVHDPCRSSIVEATRISDGREYNCLLTPEVCRTNMSKGLPK
jgi:peptide/nickel transport system ATP-binding protein